MALVGGVAFIGFISLFWCESGLGYCLRQMAANKLLEVEVGTEFYVEFQARVTIAVGGRHTGAQDPAISVTQRKLRG